MTTKSIREIIESPARQGADEQVAYQLTTTPWGSSPSSVAVAIYEMPAHTDVSSTCISGAASVLGDVITTGKVIALTPGVQYRLEIKFTTGGNIYEAYILIDAEI